MLALHHVISHAVALCIKGTMSPKDCLQHPPCCSKPTYLENLTRKEDSVPLATVEEQLLEAAQGCCCKSSNILERLGDSPF